MKKSIAAISSGTSWQTPRRTCWLVRSENPVSTIFIQEGRGGGEGEGAGGGGAREPVEEGEDLLVAVARVAGAGDLAGGDLERRVEAGRAVALVVVGHARGLAGPPLQPRAG